MTHEVLFCYTGVLKVTLPPSVGGAWSWDRYYQVRFLVTGYGNTLESTLWSIALVNVVTDMYIVGVSLSGMTMQHHA